MTRRRDCTRLSRRESTLHGKITSIIMNDFADSGIGKQMLSAGQARRSANFSSETTRIIWIGKQPSS